MNKLECSLIPLFKDPWSFGSKDEKWQKQKILEILSVILSNNAT